jgi:mRNA interferase MazF
VSPARGEVWWVSLDPTEGSEIRKTRPCLILTTDTVNRFRRTVVVVPYSTAAGSHPPITVPVTCLGQPAVAVVDQVRAIAKERLHERAEVASAEDLRTVGAAVAEILGLT